MATQEEIIDYYCRNGGLPCKRWSLKDIKEIEYGYFDDED